MAPSSLNRCTVLSDIAWAIILKKLSWQDIGHTRATCRAWRRDVDRCLQRLHLKDPTADCLTRLGKTFTHLAAVKLTAVRHDDLRLDATAGLPGALGRVGTLQLRSKRPSGSLLALGQLQLLCTSGAVLTTLCLRACEVQSWRGLEACQRLVQLQLIHCQFSREAAEGFVDALAALPSLAILEVRSGTVYSIRRGSERGNQPQHQPQPQHQQQHQPQHQVHGLLLAGLGTCAQRLAALKLSAPLSEGTVQQLLHNELPGLSNLRELDLELQPNRRPLLPMAVVGDGPEGPGANAAPLGGMQAGNAAYRELSHILPAVCVGAPQLAALRLKGHSKLSDRDMQLLQPLRQLRHLSLDLPHSPTLLLQQLPPPHPPHQQPQHQHQHEPFQLQAGEAQPSPAALEPLSAAGVVALLQAAPGLQSLSLAHVPWSLEGLRALASASGLTRMRLKGVELPKSHTLCHFLHGLRSLPHLVELDLSGCSRLSDWGLAMLGRCAIQLARLNVSGCGELVSNIGVSALAPLMRRMQRLDLSFMDKLTDSGLLGLLRNGAPSLHTLSLNYCPHIGDAGVVAIASSCPALRQLDLDNCASVSAVGAAELRGLKELRWMSAEGCPQVLQALNSAPATRPKHSRLAGRWWLACGA